MSLHRFPGAIWAPIPEAGGPLYVKTQLIYHSTGTKASAAANRRYFADQGVQVESTLVVDYDGGCLQLLEAGEKADANTTASRRAISVEVVGTADQPYTSAQIQTCIAIGRWAVDEHPIPARICPAHNRPGIGWHVMFGAPGPWTTVRGKACPGPERIRQVRDVIIPAVALDAESQIGPAEPPSPPTTPKVEDDMRVIHRPDGLAALLAAGRIYPLQPGEPDAYRSAGVAVEGVTAAEFAHLDAVSQRIAAARP